MKKKNRFGFTLIELLIVVAIIAILAAIAIPNFLAAQVRAKVTRTKAELRTLATALESYYVDYSNWPQDGTEVWKTQAYFWYVPNDVTTPISYISNSILKDPFRGTLNPGSDPLLTRYRYSNTVDGILGTSSFRNTYRDAFGAWRLMGLGPDQAYSPDNGGNQTIWGLYDVTVPYDPSNGAVSYGDIIRSQKFTNNYGSN
jgi:prepilin-type N-terminal cleavage/methylation domain-containing protein